MLNETISFSGIFIHKQKEQEAHEPHRSPEKPVQINKTFVQSCDCNITLTCREKNQSSPLFL